MKLGVEFPQEWKEKSEKENISMSDLLYGVAVENLMRRISNSSFKEYLWLTNEEALGEEAYAQKSKDRLEFVYVESAKKIYQSNPVAGHPFSQELVEVLVSELFAEKEEDIAWITQASHKDYGVDLSLTATYRQMQVPIMLRIEVAHLTTEHPKRKELKLLFEEKKSIEFLSYSKEGSLSEALFEIMRKLELISDMESYDIANEILKVQSINGRHILEDFKRMGELEPKVVSMKRLAQLQTYKNYGYMKKKWQQYRKTHKPDAEEWETVMERILNFAEPLWKALCENEIFFDDWMPELGRFLG